MLIPMLMPIVMAIVLKMESKRFGIFTKDPFIMLVTGFSLLVNTFFIFEKLNLFSYDFVNKLVNYRLGGILALVLMTAIFTVLQYCVLFVFWWITPTKIKNKRPSFI